MKDGFAAAMRRAALLTRGGDVVRATRAIRDALAGGMESRAPDAARPDPASRPPQRPDLRLVRPGTETAPSSRSSRNAGVAFSLRGGRRSGGTGSGRHVTRRCIGRR